MGIIEAEHLADVLLRLSDNVLLVLGLIVTREPAQCKILMVSWMFHVIKSYLGKYEEGEGQKRTHKCGRPILGPG